MSFTAPNPVPYRSVAGTDALPANAPRRKYPLPPECRVQFSAYAFDQDYEMRLSAFPPAPRNTVASDSKLGSLSDSNAILTSLSAPQPTLGGLGRFTAQFNIVPASWDEFKFLPFAYPSFPGIIGLPDVRDVINRTVSVRIRHDYFLCDPENIVSGAAAGGGVVSSTSLLNSAGAAVQCVYSAAEIPIIYKSNFVSTNFDGSPDYYAIVNYITPVGGKGVTSELFFRETLPTLEAYKGFIGNASGTGAHKSWNSDVWGGTSNTIGNVGQIVAKDSMIEPYAGQIIDRVTMYVLCQ